MQLLPIGLPWCLRWLRVYLQCRRPGFDPWVGKILWRRKWQPTLVFLPGEFCGQRSLVGYSPWGHKESDTLEQLTVSLSLLICVMVGDPYQSKESSWEFSWQYDL